MTTTAPGPLTRSVLAAELRHLGLEAGDVVLVHSSLKALGWVCGGPVTVVDALLDVLGPDGTLVSYAQSPDNRDPARWHHRPVPPEWWPTIRANLPAFDPATTPCRELGLVAETIRTWPGAVRSAHPQTSFTAVGAAAGDLMAVHDLESELGERSPLAALEAINARILLLGVGYDRCTAFHLAECRLPGGTPRSNACRVRTATGAEWISFEGTAHDSSDFKDLGAAYERTSGAVRRKCIGAGHARLMPLPGAVTFATAWLRQARCR
ncbi:AAC(3) family N-acetyltransferase [Luedemannella helvata]